MRRVLSALFQKINTVCVFDHTKPGNNPGATPVSCRIFRKLNAWLSAQAVFASLCFELPEI